MEWDCYNGDFEKHAKLCIGDVRSNEIFYHKNYLSPFHNRHRASKAKKDDGTDQRKKVLPQTYVWRQISNYIHHIDGCAQSLMHTTWCKFFKIPERKCSRCEWFKAACGNIMGLLWANYLCLVCGLFYLTHSWTEVIMKSVASHYL